MRVNHIKWNEDMEKRCMSVFGYACKNTDCTEVTDNFVVKEECLQSSSFDTQNHFINAEDWIEKDCSPNYPSPEEESDNSDLIMSLFLTEEQEDTLDDLDTYQLLLK